MSGKVEPEYRAVDDDESLGSQHAAGNYDNFQISSEPPIPRRRTQSYCCGSCGGKCGSFFHSKYFLFLLSTVLLGILAGMSYIYITKLNRDLDSLRLQLEDDHASTDIRISSLIAEIDHFKSSESFFESATSGKLADLADHLNSQTQKFQAEQEFVHHELNKHRTELDRLSNGTSNADVLDQLRVTKAEVVNQLKLSHDEMRESLRATTATIESQMQRNREELEMTKTEIGLQMNQTIGVMKSVVESSTLRIYDVQRNVTAQLSGVSSMMQRTAQDLNNEMRFAEKTIQEEVNLVQSNIAQYVAVTNKQFEAENDFVKYQLAGTFTVLGSLITLWHLTAHLRHYAKPDVQRRIMVVLWMVPIYGWTSWLSLVFPRVEPFFGAVRDGFEAYVVYTFVALLIAILADGAGLNELTDKLAGLIRDERRAVSDYDQEVRLALDAAEADPTGARAPILTAAGRGCPKEHIKPPFNCCFVSSNAKSTAAAWLYQCQLMAMQFVLMKPLLTLIPLLLKYGFSMDVSAAPMYDKGNVNWKSAELYILFLQNVSVAVAFYGLLSLYHGIEKELEWCDPWPKFLCIKGVVFATFWQNVLIQSMSSMGLIDERPALQIQNLVICIEMLIASVAHFYIFPYDEWQAGYKRSRETGIRLRDTLALRDFVRDMGLMVNPWDIQHDPEQDLDLGHDQDHNQDHHQNPQVRSPMRTGGNSSAASVAASSATSRLRGDTMVSSVASGAVGMDEDEEEEEDLEMAMVSSVSSASQRSTATGGGSGSGVGSGVGGVGGRSGRSERGSSQSSGSPSVSVQRTSQRSSRMPTPVDLVEENREWNRSLHAGGGLVDRDERDHHRYGETKGETDVRCSRLDEGSIGGDWMGEDTEESYGLLSFLKGPSLRLFGIHSEKIKDRRGVNQGLPAGIRARGLYSGSERREASAGLDLEGPEVAPASASTSASASASTGERFSASYGAHDETSHLLGAEDRRNWYDSESSVRSSNASASTVPPSVGQEVHGLGNGDGRENEYGMGHYQRTGDTGQLGERSRYDRPAARDLLREHSSHTVDTGADENIVGAERDSRASKRSREQGIGREEILTKEGHDSSFELVDAQQGNIFEDDKRQANSASLSHSPTNALSPSVLRSSSAKESAGSSQTAAVGNAFPADFEGCFPAASQLSDPIENPLRGRTDPSLNVRNPSSSVAHDRTTVNVFPESVAASAPSERGTGMERRRGLEKEVGDYRDERAVGVGIVAAAVTAAATDAALSTVASAKLSSLPAERGGQSLPSPIRSDGPEGGTEGQSSVLRAENMDETSGRVATELAVTMAGNIEETSVRAGAATVGRRGVLDAVKVTDDEDEENEANGEGESAGV